MLAGAAEGRQQRSLIQKQECGGMKRKLAANRANLHVTAAIAAVVGMLSIPAPASAKNDSLVNRSD
jgi:hypothetical protein